MTTRTRIKTTKIKVPDTQQWCGLRGIGNENPVTGLFQTQLSGQGTKLSPGRGPHMPTKEPVGLGEIVDDLVGDESVTGQSWADKLVNEARALQKAAGLESRPTVRPSSAAADGQRRSLKSLSRQSQMRLPYWPEGRRAVPNDMARSAMFTVRQSEARLQFKGHKVAALKNIEILYTGEELRQRDEDVLLQLLHYGRLANLGDPIRFVAAEMLRSLGWTMNSRSYKELAECIERLQSGSVNIVSRVKEEERRFGGSLIRTFDYLAKGSAGSAQWVVTFEPLIIAQFNHVAYSQIDWEQRRQLTPLAKWLHSFYYSHRHPFPMKVATIRDLCGSSSKTLRRFRQSLKGALTELQRIGFVAQFTIRTESDLVEVERHAESSIGFAGQVAG